MADQTYEVTSKLLPSNIATLLFMEWIHYLAHQRLNLPGWGSSSTSTAMTSQYTFSRSDGRGFKLLKAADKSSWRVEADQFVNAEDIHSIIREAQAKVQAGEYGDDVVYSTTLISPAPGTEFHRDFGVHFMRALGDQVAINGRRRLSDRVLLNFQIASTGSEERSLFVPEIKIDVQAIVPGPCGGPLSDQVAWGMLETTRLLCTLALGRLVDGPPSVFSLTDQAAIDEAKRARLDPSILGLARDHVSLDVFGELQAYGGSATAIRVRSSLVPYEAALRQTNADVATVLFVSALEALIVPHAEWRIEKVVSRFIHALQGLCPQVVDSLIHHSNVEEAFGLHLRGGAARRRREILQRVYDLRSIPVHGHWGLPSGMVKAMSDSGAMRTALLSDLYRGAFLAFIQAPRSFLTGHPAIDPSLKNT